MGCLFCQIASREIPARIVAENDYAIAFRDLHPVAPTHVLVVPKKHISGVGAADETDAVALGEVLLMARSIGNSELRHGYRLVINHGADAGQSVFHLHVHVLGGRTLAWPPG